MAANSGANCNNPEDEHQNDTNDAEQTNAAVMTPIYLPYDFGVNTMLRTLAEKIFYDNEYFHIITRQEPFQLTKRICDIMIKYPDHKSGQYKFLCFFEVHSLPFYSATTIMDLERQALRWCQQCIVEQGGHVAYAATVITTHIRLWRHKAGSDKLEAMWGDEEPGAYKQYKDPGDAHQAMELCVAFADMLRDPPTPLH